MTGREAARAGHAPGAGPRDAIEAERLALAVTAAVEDVPAVAGLHPGAYGHVATYLPGRVVTGVQIGDGRTAVHVVLWAGFPLVPAVDSIRAAVAGVTGGPVDVTIEDVASPATPTIEGWA